jgi:hypothetical protein
MAWTHSSLSPPCAQTPWPCAEDPRWALDYPGSAMMPPVYFVWIAVAIAGCICGSECDSVPMSSCTLRCCRRVEICVAWHWLRVLLSGDVPPLSPQLSQLLSLSQWRCRLCGAVLGGAAPGPQPVQPAADGAEYALPSPAVSKGKAASGPAAGAAAENDEDGVFSREASKLLAAAECGAGSRGGSFTAGLRQQGSLHMRSDSANDDSARVSSELCGCAVSLCCGCVLFIWVSFRCTPIALVGLCPLFPSSKCTAWACLGPSPLWAGMRTAFTSAAGQPGRQRPWQPGRRRGRPLQGLAILYCRPAELVTVKEAADARRPAK